MADSEKRFPPSEIKLRRLRGEGIFPRTALAATFGAAAGGSAAFVAAVSKYGESSRTFFAESAAGKVGGSLGRFLSLFSGGALLIAGIIAAAVLLSQLVQTRFYLNFASMFPRRAASVSTSARLRSLAGSLVCCVMVFLLAWWFLVDAASYYRETFLPLVFERKFRGAAPINLSEMKNNLESALRLLLAVEIELFRARIGMLAETLIGVLLFAAIIARVIVGIRFQQEHGMTREELEVELKEGEVSQQLREAQRSRAVEAQSTHKLRSDSEPDNS